MLSMRRCTLSIRRFMRSLSAGNGATQSGKRLNWSLVMRLEWHKTEKTLVFQWHAKLHARSRGLCVSFCHNHTICSPRNAAQGSFSPPRIYARFHQLEVVVAELLCERCPAELQP